MLLKNKKADEKLLSPFMFLIWIIIIVGISAGAAIFYGAVFDVRFEESNILNNRITDCLIERGYINNNLLKSDFDLFSICGLDKHVLTEVNVFYIQVNLKDYNSLNDLITPLKFGDPDLINQCLRDSKGNKLGLCISQEFDVLYLDNDSKLKRAKLEVLTGSNNQRVG